MGANYSDGLSSDTDSATWFSIVRRENKCIDLPNFQENYKCWNWYCLRFSWNCQWLAQFRSSTQPGMGEREGREVRGGSCSCHWRRLQDLCAIGSPPSSSPQHDPALGRTACHHLCSIFKTLSFPLPTLLPHYRRGYPLRYKAPYRLESTSSWGPQPQNVLHLGR